MTYPIVQMLNTRKHNGISGIPTQLLVLHDAESPLRGGYARSLTNWANTTAVEASWHWFVDPVDCVQMVPPQYAAWHASEANPMSEGFEQGGYARFSREEWLTPDGYQQLDRLAWLWAQRSIANGIPARWLTTQEVDSITKYGNRTLKGWCLHRQVDPETRTDPGNHYPFDVFTERVLHYMGAGTAPEPAREWDEMATEAQVKTAAKAAAREAFLELTEDPNFLDRFSLHALKRPVNLIDPNTGQLSGTTDQATKIRWQAYLFAQIGRGQAALQTRQDDIEGKLDAILALLQPPTEEPAAKEPAADTDTVVEEQAAAPEESGGETK